MTVNELLHADITEKIIVAFYKVYNTLGYGFFESVYSNALAIELQRSRLRAAREVPVRVVYQGVDVGTYRIDLLIEGMVIVEVKSTPLLTPSDQKQLGNYLKASELEVGLLLNFGPTPKVRRQVHTRNHKAAPEVSVVDERT